MLSGEAAAELLMAAAGSAAASFQPAGLPAELERNAP